MHEPELLFGLLIVCVLSFACVAALARQPSFGLWQQPGRPEAQERAEALLKELLTEDEYRQLTRCGYLEVRSRSRPRRTYRVPRHQGQVKVYEGGVPSMGLCVQSVEPIPAGDVVLMHKLMIEGNEDEYLRIANRFEYPATPSVTEQSRA